MERLQKILSQAGVASRRASEQLMLEGRVMVNGTTVRELGTKADPAQDDIRVDGRRIRVAERHVYLLLNKPSGFVTTRSDPERRPTVLDLLPGVREYVYPVGRLDFDSEGLLLLTNDGDLAARLTHPSHGVQRVYEARVLGAPDEKDLRRLSQGLVVDGHRTLPAEIERLVVKGDRTTLRVTLREGRNRQVRRMCEAIGHPVEHLRRVAIGPLRDTRLRLGQWRPLTAEEVAWLKKAARGAAPTAKPAPGAASAAAGEEGPAPARRRRPAGRTSTRTSTRSSTRPAGRAATGHGHGSGTTRSKGPGGHRSHKPGDARSQGSGDSRQHRTPRGRRSGGPGRRTR